jgi:hypothetical protein
MLVGPLGRAALAAPGCAGQLACRRWDRALGGERREKMMGLMSRKRKIAGAWVKKELKLILPRVKSKIFEYHFCSTFQDVHFLFCDNVHLSNI